MVMVKLHEFGQRADYWNMFVEFVEQGLDCGSSVRVRQVPAVPRRQEFDLVDRCECNMHGIKSSLGWQEPPPDQLRRYEVYLRTVGQDTYASHCQQPLGGHGGVATTRLHKHHFRRHELVSVPMAIPPRPRDRLLFRELFAEFRDHYPIVLTRARHGMVIFVPPGAKRDRTRRPAFYEGVYEYLTNLGGSQV
jgi:hypothetical protein